jgi:hypothetical protein
MEALLGWLITRVLLLVLAWASLALLYAALPREALVSLMLAGGSAGGLIYMGYRRVRRDGLLPYLPTG